MCIEIIGKQVLFFNSSLRTQCTSVFVHIVDSLRGLIFNDCFPPLYNMEYVRLIPVFQPLNKICLF
jgi:hypothetical protein